MKILAIDFSSDQRSVAAFDARSGAAGEAAHIGGRFAPAFALADTAFAQAGFEREQVDCIAVGLGPGSYTGIRAAIALAQGWALARTPTPPRLVGVSSVDCLAAQARAEGLRGLAHAVVDAQRGEFYLATYQLDSDPPRLEHALCLANADFVRERERAGGTLIGPQVTRWFPGGRIVHPRAAILARLAASRMDFQPGEKLEPIYLRETAFVKAPPPRQPVP